MDGEQVPLLHTSSGGGNEAKHTQRTIYVLSVGFLVVFLAYNSLQNYVTSLLPGNLGSTSLAVLYISVTVTCFVAPKVVASLGEKWTMVLGAACYLVYMISTIWAIKEVVLAAAVVIGFGASVLWIAMGSYVTRASHPARLGHNNSIFWLIFQLSNVLGNLGAYYLFDNAGSKNLFIGFSGACALGTIVLCFVTPVRKLTFQYSQDNEAEGENQEEEATHGACAWLNSMWVDIKETVRVLCTNEMLALAYIFAFVGLELAFWAGEFTQLLEPRSIGIVLTFAGVGEFVGSIICTRLTDKIGYYLMFVLIIFFGGALGICVILKDYPHLVTATWQDAPVLAFVAAFCFGLSDSIVNTQCYSLLGKLSTGKVMVRTFTVFNIHQNIGSAVGFYYSQPLPLHGPNGTLSQIWVLLFFLLVGTILFIRVDIKYGQPRVKARKALQEEKQQVASRTFVQSEE
eukprot:m.73400 g.73400  ORF g.73400 m.73400 type:complete len:457 (-) comp12367_c0_seq4:623-1993(-)